MTDLGRAIAEGREALAKYDRAELLDELKACAMPSSEALRDLLAALDAAQAPPAELAVPATMADGWRHDICATLNRVMPSWIAAGRTPIEAACNAIEALAAVACEAHDKPAAAVPDGMALVPVEPTTAMKCHAVEAWEGPAVYKSMSARGLANLEDKAAECWAAMLAAALAERNNTGDNP